MSAEPQIDPISAVSPDLPTATATELQKSIASIGQLVPIVRWRGKIIDGRKRLAACRALGREPLVVEIADDASAGDHAAALNILRTHYTPTQLAIYASELATLKKGQKEGQANRSIDLSGGMTEKNAAAKFGIGEAQIRRAKRLKREAPELYDVAKKGALALHAAGKIAQGTPKAEHRTAAVTAIATKGVGRNMPARAIQPVPAPVSRATKARPSGDVVARFFTQLEYISDSLRGYVDRPLPEGEERKQIAAQLERTLRVLFKFRKRLREGEAR